jgi:cytochrome P450
MSAIAARDLALPELDFDARFYREPQRTLAPLLERGARMARVPALGSTLLARYRDVHAAFTNHALGAIGVRYYSDQGWTEGPYIDWLQRTVVFLDPPDHDRLRGLVARAFTPRQVARVRPITERIASDLADVASEGGEVDLYDAFAQRLPLQVICEMLAIPTVDCEELGRWTAALSLATARPTPEARAAADAAMLSFQNYVGELIAERRPSPGEDLLSALIAVEEAGDRLSQDELVAMVVQMLYAGHETTRNLIGNGLFALLEHPAELARLRGDRSLVRSAVEEMLRYEPPIIYVTRIALADQVLCGVEIPKGHMVHLAIASANRDPETFEDPDRFDVARRDNRHLSFGFGAHFCLGASIARMEGQVAFETLLDRFERIEHAGGEKPLWAKDTALRTLEEFPVRLVAA